MSKHRRDPRRPLGPLLLSLGLVAASAGLLSCLPMVNPGFISMQPRHSGAVDVQVNGGGGFPYLVYGSVHVEPYATERLSIPIGILGSYPGVGAGRVGLRYRVTPVLSVGGGVGGGFFAVSYSINDSEGSFSQGFGLVDFELGLGRRWGIFAISFAFRPTYVIPLPMAQFPVELGLALYFHRNWNITLFVNGGVGVIYDGAMFGAGGGLGIVGHL